MKKFQFLISLILFICNSNLHASSDSTEYKLIKLNFKVGFNSKYIIKSNNLESKNVDWGFYIESHITPRFSILLAINTLRLRNKSSSTRVIDFNKLTRRETTFVFRYRLMNTSYSLFPELGVGNWGRNMGLFLVGTGFEYKVWQNIFSSIAIKYDYVCNRCLDVGGGGDLIKFYRINFKISYLFNMKLKGKSINPKVKK